MSPLSHGLKYAGNNVAQVGGQAGFLDWRHSLFVVEQRSVAAGRTGRFEHRGLNSGSAALSSRQTSSRAENAAALWEFFCFLLAFPSIYGIGPPMKHENIHPGIHQHATSPKKSKGNRRTLHAQAEKIRI